MVEHKIHAEPTFDEVVLPHLDSAYNLARWLTRNEQDAEDIVQEAYLRAFRYFPSFQGGEAKAWLMKIVRNTCYTWMDATRSLRNSVEFDEKVFATEGRDLDPEQTLLQNDKAGMVRKALRDLPSNFREVLILRELEGMSYREIGEIAGIPTGTVMSSLSRGRGRLREALTSLMSGDEAANSQGVAATNA
jgi:RNA polymerase sigma-70 factor (ECF subfamily)